MSAKACAGILRRAFKRKRPLPEILHLALLVQAGALEAPTEHDPEIASLLARAATGEPIPYQKISHCLNAGGMGRIDYETESFVLQRQPLDECNDAPGLALPGGYRLAVRRLLPVECERLQGFRDGHTGVPYRGRLLADGVRYKALGNSMAVPCMAWLGARIDAAIKAASSPASVAA